MTAMHNRILAALIWMAGASAAQPRPNLVYILADDMGYGDPRCQNPASPIETPNIDRLAREGMRFTDAHTPASLCTPTRYGILTGRYAWRGRLQQGVLRQYDPPLLEAGRPTVGSLLQQQGYATACVGKWHLGRSAPYLPTARGFDEFFGTLGNTPFFHPRQFIDSRRSTDVIAIEDPAFYTTDAYADRAVDWLRKRNGSPWFLYLPFNAQHAPLEAPQRYLDRFPTIPEGKRRTFAAMMAAMDDAVGRVLTTVRELGQEENTLVWFIADNGGPTPSTTSGNGPLRGFKMTTYEGGPRVPFLVRWKGRIPAGTTYDRPVVNLDVVPTVLAAAGQPVAAADRIDGVDILPHLAGTATGRPHDTLFWRFGEQWAVRKGDWKLVVSKGGGGTPELYDLANDVGEQSDRAAEEPAKVAELQRLYDAWNAEQSPPSARDTPAAKKNRQPQAVEPAPPGKAATKQPATPG